MRIIAANDKRRRWNGQISAIIRAGIELAPSGEITVPGKPIRVALNEMFAELDRA
jgi:hypothetical protein